MSKFFYNVVAENTKKYDLDRRIDVPPRVKTTSGPLVTQPAFLLSISERVEFLLQPSFLLNL